MVQIATNALHLLKENLDKDEFEEFVSENEIDEEQMDFFGFKKENGYYYEQDYEEKFVEDEIYFDEEFDDSAAWEDDSDRGCKDCPPDECTGHCMSCYYRPV